MGNPLRPCLGLGGNPCGLLTRNPKGRCRPCQQAFDAARNRNPKRRVLYGGGWYALSRAARQAEPWCHCDRPACHGNRRCLDKDLTLDHETGRVECRVCNSRHRRNVGG